MTFTQGALFLQKSLKWLINLAQTVHSCVSGSHSCKQSLFLSKGGLRPEVQHLNLR